jgi:hypothetical protein
MSTSRYSESDLISVEHLLGYFDQQVLAAYRNEPQKYKIESDYFEGELTVTNEYYSELESTGKTGEVVSIGFGYRTLRDGNLAIVAWLPDLFEKSKAHVQRWSAFHLKNPEWTTDYDERFGNWVLRYLEGSWDVDNGPLHYLGQTIRTINGLTTELVGTPLYKHEIDETLGYPAAENTHRYQDSHKGLYGYLIDGLDRDCISRLASSLGKSFTVGDKNTIQAITKLFPDLETSPNFVPAVKLVSEQRRLASHGVRPRAENFPAFSQFTKDLSLCLEAVKELLAMLERDFGVNGEEVHKRYEAKKWLPHINRPPEAHYSIVQASRMKGKTIEKVELGFRKEIEGVHESEALLIYFTDGSIMSLEAGSNVGNLVSDENGLRPEDFHVDFIVHWVPEQPKGMPKPSP